MCVREDPNEMDYIVVDCSAEHEEEVMSRDTLARSKEYPGDAAVEDAAQQKCESAFASYVGLELVESRLDLDLLHPGQGQLDRRQSHTDLSRAGPGPRPNHPCTAGRQRIGTPTPDHDPVEL